MQAVAGIVVTEMATSTAELPAVSYASMPAMPAARATSTVPGPTLGNDWPSTVAAKSTCDPMRPETRRNTVVAAATATTSSPASSVTSAIDHRARRPSTTDGRGRDRQEIGAERYRADDQDGGAGDNADARDHPGRHHVEQEDEARSGVFTSTAQHRGPNEAVAAEWALATPTDRLHDGDPRQDEVLRPELVVLKQTDNGIGGRGVEVGGQLDQAARGLA